MLPYYLIDAAASQVEMPETPEDGSSGGALLPDRTLSRTFGAPVALPRERMMPIHCRVLNHWEAARRGHPALRNVDFDPYEIRHALPNVALWEIAPGGGYRCRLSGAEVDENAGGSLKGVSLAEIPCALIHDAVEEFDIVRDRLVPCFVERTMAWAGMPFRYYRHLLLPLIDEKGAAERLLSVLTFHSVAELPMPGAGRPGDDMP